jgi:hypothetical protein
VRPTADAVRAGDTIDYWCHVFAPLDLAGDYETILGGLAAVKAEYRAALIAHDHAKAAGLLQEITDLTHLAGRVRRWPRGLAAAVPARRQAVAAGDDSWPELSSAGCLASSIVWLTGRGRREAIRQLAGLRRRLAAAEDARADALAAMKQAEAEFDAASDRFDAAERILDEAREDRAQARRERYTARQAHERASVTADRLARRVRELAGRLDGT